MAISTIANQAENATQRASVLTENSKQDESGLFASLLDGIQEVTGINKPAQQSISETDLQLDTGASTPASLEDLLNTPEVIATLQNNLVAALKSSLLGAMASSTTASTTSVSGADAGQSLTEARTQAQSNERISQATDVTTTAAPLVGEPMKAEPQSDFIDSVMNLSFGEDGLGMEDVFDTVNVLNHIPVVSEIYQNVSEHKVDAFSSLAGGFMMFGPVGLAVSAVDVATEQFTGKSMLSNAFDFAAGFFSDEATTSTETPAVSQGEYR